MIRYSVRPEKQKELEARMRELGVREEDLEEENIRTSGRGGQKRNKTSCGVSLYHRPSGIRIKCCESRSLSMNRFFARRRLVEKMESRVLGTESPENRRVEKLKKQKERRRRRTKKKQSDQADGFGE